nr:beta-ketoacyl reductase [Actinomadura sp. CNU-125]
MLITGGTGGLGAVLARHLVRRHGVRHLVLAGGARRRARRRRAGGRARRARRARHARRLRRGRPRGRGAAAGRDPGRAPADGGDPRGGVLDDATLTAQTPERVAAVLRPKAHGARHLHELTADADLTAFVLFSSLAGTIGSAGQAPYAAANAHLDALAAHRAAAGLPALSLAWGLWEEGSGLTEGLDRADLARLARGGTAALSTERALELFDAALRMDEPVLVPFRPDVSALGAADVPPMLRGLVRAGLPRAAAPDAAGPERTGGASALARRLAGLPEAERAAELLGVVRRQVAAVLGYSGADHRRGRPGVPGARFRLPHRTGAAQPARDGHRAAAPGDRRVRPSLPRGASRPSAPNSRATPRRPRRRTSGRPRPTATRSRSSAWPAGSPAASGRPRTCGGSCSTAPTRSATSPPTGAGTRTCTTPTPTPRGSR